MISMEDEICGDQTLSSDWPQLLFDFDEGDIDQHTNTTDSTGHRCKDNMLSELQALCRPTNDFENKLLADIRRFDLNLLSEFRRQECTIGLAAFLSSLGYEVFIRDAIGGGYDRKKRYNNLQNTFLMVKERSEKSRQDGLKIPSISGASCFESDMSDFMIVDINMREHFEIGCEPTLAYQEVMQEIPLAFVGKIDRLGCLVRLLCAEMAMSFSATGRSLPPWRTCKSMMTKFDPERFTDYAAPELQSSAREFHSAAKCSQKALPPAFSEERNAPNCKPAKQLGFACRRSSSAALLQILL